MVITILQAPTPAPVPIFLVQMHPHLWERIISVNQEGMPTIYFTQRCGTLMTLCGTHRDVRVGAHAAIVVVRGSLPHWTRK